MSCKLCGNEENLNHFDGNLICSKCIRQLKVLKPKKIIWNYAGYKFIKLVDKTSTIFIYSNSFISLDVFQYYGEGDDWSLNVEFKEDACSLTIEKDFKTKQQAVDWFIEYFGSLMLQPKLLC